MLHGTSITTLKRKVVGSQAIPTTLKRKVSWMFVDVCSGGGWFPHQNVVLQGSCYSSALLASAKGVSEMPVVCAPVKVVTLLHSAEGDALLQQKCSSFLLFWKKLKGCYFSAPLQSGERRSSTKTHSRGVWEGEIQDSGCLCLSGSRQLQTGQYRLI